MPTGSVLQVVSNTYSTATSTTSASFVTTNLAGSITPKFTTSKILVFITCNFQIGGTADNGAGILVSRNGTNIWIGNNASFYIYASTGGSLQSGFIATINYLDSPASTSSLTYTLQMQSRNSITTIAQYANTPSIITLMEIAG
jgi:hypothetical protein